MREGDFFQLFSKSEFGKVQTFDAHFLSAGSNNSTCNNNNFACCTRCSLQHGTQRWTSNNFFSSRRGLQCCSVSPFFMICIQEREGTQRNTGKIICQNDFPRSFVFRIFSFQLAFYLLVVLPCPIPHLIIYRTAFMPMST